MKEIQYKQYKASVEQCPCCNKYLNGDVFYLNENNQWTKLLDVLLAKADNLEQLQQEFELTVEDYLEFIQEI